MKAIKAKTKATYEPLMLLKDINSWCARGHWLLRIDDFQKDIETKKTLLPSPTNYTSEQFS